MFDTEPRVLCPLVTPFESVDSDGDAGVDTDALASIVSHLADAGVDGFVPCGTTGEFASLTPEERRRVVETTVDAAPDDAPVIAGAADTSVESVHRRIGEVADAGADAALVVPPYYVTAQEPSGNRAFFQAVADGSDLPVVLYNVPKYAHDALEAETVAAMADHDAVVGLKDTSGDLTRVIEVLDRVPDSFRVFQGFDGQLVPGLYVGMAAGVNALSHAIPGALNEAVEAVRAGDHDRALAIQRDAVTPLFRRGAEYGFAATTKVLLAHRGLLDSVAVRPPLDSLDSDERDDVESTLDRVDDAVDEF
ncbi:MAG: dihydrodipicolinate synthase family protein [Halosimplex sp.]